MCAADAISLIRKMSRGLWIQNSPRGMPTLPSALSASTGQVFQMGGPGPPASPASTRPYASQTRLPVV